MTQGGYLLPFGQVVVVQLHVEVGDVPDLGIVPDGQVEVEVLALGADALAHRHHPADQEPVVQRVHVGVGEVQGHVPLHASGPRGRLLMYDHGPVVVLVVQGDLGPRQGITLDGVGQGPSVLLPDVELKGRRGLGNGRTLDPDGEHLNLDHVLRVAVDDTVPGRRVLRLDPDVPYGRPVEARGLHGPLVDAGGDLPHVDGAPVGVVLELTVHP